MAMGEQPISAPMRRMETLSYPSRANSSRAVSRIWSRSDARAWLRANRRAAVRALRVKRILISATAMFTPYTLDCQYRNLVAITSAYGLREVLENYYSNKRWSQGYSRYQMTFTRAASACRGFRRKLYVSGTMAEGTFRRAVLPEASHSSPIVLVTTRSSFQFGARSDSCTLRIEMSSRASAFSSLYEVGRLRRSSSRCTRISASAPAGVSAR